MTTEAAFLGAAFTAVWVALPNPLDAQAISTEIHVGLNRSSASADAGPSHSIPAASGGGMVLFSPFAWIGFRSGVAIHRRGFDVETESVNTGGIRLTYVEIPALVTYGLASTATKGLSSFLFLGPSIGLEIGCRVVASAPSGAKSSVGCADIGLATKTFDYGFMFGGGLRFAVGSVDLFSDISYSLGLVDIGGGTDSIKNRNLGVSFGVLFPMGPRS